MNAFWVFFFVGFIDVVFTENIFTNGVRARTRFIVPHYHILVASFAWRPNRTRLWLGIHKYRSPKRWLGIWKFHHVKDSLVIGHEESAGAGEWDGPTQNTHKLHSSMVW